MTTASRIALLCAASLAACAGPPDAQGPQGAAVAITVAPLNLPGVTNASWRLTVTAGAQTVWTRDLSSRAYGDGAGSLSYVGPCDADAGANTITLELLALYGGAAGDALIDAGGYSNPGALTRTVTCLPNADVPVDFDVTLARAATQGFFDVAVTFDDLFCSAKLDCEQPDGSDIVLLTDASGARRPTVVLGFACTADTAANDTVLYLDPVTVTCTGGSAVVDPAAGPGQLAPGAGISQAAPILFGAAVYRGREDLGGVGKIYWNLALGLELGTAPVQNCALTTQGTAASGALANNATAPGSTYPFVTWSVPLTTTGAALTCTQHPVGGDNGVAIAYADPDAPEPFANSFNGATALPFAHTVVGARTALDPARWSNGTFATSCDAYRHPTAPYTYAGAIGDGVYRVDADGEGPGGTLDVACDMATDGGGWTLILRDDWATTGVAKGLTSLPTQNSAGVPTGTGDFVGPWTTYVGHYLYKRVGVGGDNAFIAHQSFRLDATAATIAANPGYSYDEPLLTLAGGATVMADSDPSHRLNYFYREGTAPCGAVATGRDNGGNCWNNFFGTAYWDNMPGGNSDYRYPSTPHIAELWVRAAPAPVDPHAASVVLLAHFDGADGSTVMTDEMGHTLVREGNPVLSTAQSHSGGSSLYLDGASDVLFMPSDGALNFGTGDFTIEIWAYVPGYTRIAFGYGNYGAENALRVLDYGAGLHYCDDGASGGCVSAGTAPGPGVWFHVAAQRSAGNVTVWFNGTLAGSVADAASYNTTCGVRLGAYDGPDGTCAPGYHFEGYLDDVRVTKGVARYTGPFTP